MGWCTEFGPRIQHDCDEPMVAGPSSCSCAACGVVCTGRFVGCPNVWAQGPQDVSLVAAPLPSRAPARLPPPAGRGGAGNGNGNGNGNGKKNGLALRASDPRSAADEGGELSADDEALARLRRESATMAGLLDEMRVLKAQLEQAQKPAADFRDMETVRTTEMILREFDALPVRIAGAMSAALREQHRAIMTEVRNALREALIEFRTHR